MIAAAAAAVAITVTAAGCTATTAGHPAVVPAAAPATAIAPATAEANGPVTHDWRNVDGQLPLSLPQRGGAAAPGVEIVHDNGADLDVCTIGPAVWTNTTRNAGILTAGHCGDEGSLWTFDDAGNSALGTVAESELDYGDGHYTRNQDGTLADAALIGTTVAASATAIAGNYHIAGVLTSNAAREKIDKGAAVCIDGAESGILCGHSRPGESNEIDIKVSDKRGRSLDKPGDSGAVAFLVEDGPRPRAALVGLVSGHTEIGGTVITYLDPLLARFHVSVLLDPSVEPFTDDSFSANVIHRN